VLRSRIPQIAIELDLRVEEALEQGAEDVAEAARARVHPHRLTGRLEDAIHVQEEQEGFYVVAGGDAELEDYRVRDVFWGHMLEHGTSHSAPHPFLVPALEENRGEVVARVTAVLKGL